MFCKEYYTRSLYRRIAIQEKLGGGVAGAAWAEYYFKARGDYPPKVGERKQGNIEWHDANPGIKRAINLISGDPKNFSVIQLGASSGKVISHLAENFPESFCIYSDIFEEVTSFAEKKINLPNLEFVTCPSESLPALVQVAKTKKVLIISIGSSQYVQPENVDKTFRLLSKVKNKEIDFILDELGSKYKTNLNNLKGSKPRGKLSYTHNYKYYAEKNGFVKYVDLKQGVSFRESIDDTTGISSKIVIDWSQNQKSKNFKPAINILANFSDEPNEENNFLNYPMSIDSILSVEDGQEVTAGQVIARIPKESSKTKDITGGLPRVAELFEARKPKDHAIIAEVSGKVEFGKDYKMKRKISIVPNDSNLSPVEYVISKSKHLTVQEGDVVEIGDVLVDGNSVPHDILRVKGVEALATYLTKEVQDVYRLQGVKINDKHIEVIVRQMMQKIEITDPGETTLLAGEQVSRKEFLEQNMKAQKENRAPAKGYQILLGITKASLQTDSFVSAASFQETTRVLTEASVSGKVDSLMGLKENVIVGRLVPCGTGSFMSQVKLEANQKDKELLSKATQNEEKAS